MPPSSSSILFKRETALSRLSDNFSSVSSFWRMSGSGTPCCTRNLGRESPNGVISRSNSFGMHTPFPYARHTHRSVPTAGPERLPMMREKNICFETSWICMKHAKHPRCDGQTHTQIHFFDGTPVSCHRALGATILVRSCLEHSFMVEAARWRLRVDFFETRAVA